MIFPTLSLLALLAGPNFAGTYETKVALKNDACGGSQVMDNPTIVTHDTTSKVITLTHAGTTYGGLLKADSSFALQPKEIDFKDGFIYTVGVSGRFTPGGLAATVSVDKAGKGATCRFVAEWVGPRK